MSKAGGILSWDYVNLTNIPASGTSKFYAGVNSTDGGGNTNWIFTNPPVLGGIVKSLSIKVSISIP